MNWAVRNAVPGEEAALAALWHGAWNDAHSAVVPAELTRMRTLASFETRVARDLAAIRTAGAVGAPTGFCMTRKDELYQLFVGAAVRRGGVASALAADAEARIRAAGHDRAWLACAIGNERAAAFYRARGWDLAGTVVERLEAEAGEVFEMAVWRFERAL